MSLGEGIALAPGEGSTLLSPSGLAQVLKVGAAATRGAYSLWESVTLPDEGPAPHIHHGHEEAFYILGGELTMLLAERTIVAGVGSFVVVPRGAVHAFRNHGQEPARLLTIMSPPMDRFRIALTEHLLMLPDDRPRAVRSLDPALVATLQQQHGVVDELVEGPPGWR